MIMLPNYEGCNIIRSNNTKVVFLFVYTLKCLDSSLYFSLSFLFSGVFDL